MFTATALRHLLLLLFHTATTTASVWPIPKHEVYHHDLPTLYIAPTTTFVPTLRSTILSSSIARYSAILTTLAALRPPTTPPPPAHTLHHITVQVSNADPDLSATTSFRYNLTVLSPHHAILSADTVHGAAHALETFVQIFHNGSSKPAIVHDAPSFPWRGLMLDVGRRFAPVPMVQNLLDTMSFLKLSVLHFHASDYCRWSIESVHYPQLTSKLQPGMADAGLYTQQDIRTIVAYAKERGIRVVPEFDLPGHAYQWAKVLEDTGTGLTLCKGSDYTIYNDPSNNASLRVLTTVRLWVLLGVY